MRYAPRLHVEAIARELAGCCSRCGRPIQRFADCLCYRDKRRGIHQRDNAKRKLTLLIGRGGPPARERRWDMQAVAVKGAVPKLILPVIPAPLSRYSWWAEDAPQHSYEIFYDLAHARMAEWRRERQAVYAREVDGI